MAFRAKFRLGAMDIKKYPKFAKKIDMNSNSKYRSLFLSTKRHIPIRINAIMVIVPYTADTLYPSNAKNGLSIIRRLPQWGLCTYIHTAEGYA